MKSVIRLLFKLGDRIPRLGPYLEDAFKQLACQAIYAYFIDCGSKS